MPGRGEVERRHKQAPAIEDKTIWRAEERTRLSAARQDFRGSNECKGTRMAWANVQRQEMRMGNIARSPVWLENKMHEGKAIYNKAKMVG